MSQRPAAGGSGPSYPRESLRLTFSYDGERVELVLQERLEMITAPTLGELPEAEVNSGTWLELRDSRDGRVAVVPVHDPFRTAVDHHSPDGHIEHVTRELEAGEFDVLVPAVRDATSVALYSSEMAASEDVRGAVEVARFELGPSAR